MKVNVLVGKKQYNYEDSCDAKILIDVDHGNLLIQRQHKLKDSDKAVIGIYPRGSWDKIYVEKAH